MKIQQYKTSIFYSFVAMKSCYFIYDVINRFSSEIFLPVGWHQDGHGEGRGVIQDSAELSLDEVNEGGELRKS
jgi:hypothetical protein